VPPFFAQELPTSCVAACVRMVLAGLGHVLPEPAIRTRCGYSKVGMRLNQVGSGLVDLPVVVQYHIDWSLDDIIEALRRPTFPIVGIDLRPVDEMFGFHALVLLSMSSSSVVVLDPNLGTRTIGLSAFEIAWNEAEREAVTVNARSSI
jgi:ABC-type bacteriocin/lantibiotic exporter with double-glycine peptidase domain